MLYMADDVLMGETSEKMSKIVGKLGGVCKAARRVRDVEMDFLSSRC